MENDSEYRYQFCDGTWNTALNGLYLACLNSHPNIARLLLEAGINDSDYARGWEAVPLYYAVRQGYDDVALVLLEHFTDINLPLSWTNSRSIPLHLASHLGLPSLVRFLLSPKADVLVEDTDGMTALQYALLGSREVCMECFEGSFFGMRSEIMLKSKGKGWGSDVETVTLLLEAGSDVEKQRECGS
jgi:ankyrin repeat protein